MEAASAQTDQARVEIDKARRIVGAMRESVGALGAAGSTFDEVAARAGVSRGLLHYYFGSKERLLAEVVRHDCEIRIGELRTQLAAAGSLDELVAIMLARFEDFVEDQAALIFELFTASRDHAEIKGELGELYRGIRETVAEALEAKQQEGVVRLRADARSVASIIFAMADGAALQILSDPGWDPGDALATGVGVVRHLLGE